MATSTYTVTSFNGVNLASGNLRAKFIRRDANPLTRNNTGAVEATIPGKGQQDIRSQPKAAVWRLYVTATNTDETDIDNLLQTFSEELGLVYLRATDGSSVSWRIECRVIGVERMQDSTNVYVVTLRVPKPIWEKNSADTSVTNANQTTTPFDQTITTVGNRDTDDLQITISPDTAKSKGYADYAYSFPGFLVNRAPNALVNEPCYLCDQSGAAARLATDSSATGATVQRTTSSTTVTVNIAAGATTITCTSVAAFSASGGLGWITDSRGVGFHDQFSYTGISGLVLQGVVWLPAAANGREPSGTVQTAGGIAHTTVQVTNIRSSGLMLSADDLAVWMDGQRLDSGVYPVAWNSAASDVLMSVTMPKRKYKTITAAMTAVAPANGGEVIFLEGVSDLPEKGYFVIDNEVFAYNARDVAARKVTDVRRAMHGSAAATHVINSTAEFSIKLFVVAVGKATSGVTERPLAFRPCIQVPTSSNLKQYWGDESADANTAFFDSRYPNRPKAWKPGFDSDGNTVSPLLSISQSRTALTFKDDVPGDGNPARNYAEMFCPQGIDAGNATAIVADWTPSPEILNLEMFARDANGILKLIDQLQQVAAAANRSPSSFAEIQYGLKLKGRHNVVTGEHDPNLTAVTVINNTAMGVPADNGNVAVQFKLDQDTLIAAVTVRLSATGAGSQVVGASIHSETSTLPVDVDSGLVVAFGTAAAITVNSTSAVVYRFTAQRPFRLAAGTYWLMLYRSTAAVVTVNWYNTGNHAFSPRNYRGGQRAAGVWSNSNGTYDFKICSAYDAEYNAPIQSEMPLKIFGVASSRSALTASFDGMEVTLEPSQTVYVHRMSAFASAMYHYSEEIERTAAAGNKITLDRWGIIPSSVTVDCEARVCTYTENGYDDPFGPILRDGAYIELEAPGSNTITFTVPDIAQTDYTSAFRSKKV